MTEKIDLYTLIVSLFDAPITEKFLEKNPVVARTIVIRGDQTLEDLHEVIFKAFNREEEHLYEFQLGGEGPDDPAATCYGVYVDGKPSGSKRKKMKDASKAKMSDLQLAPEEAFGYCFDFGDCWWHQINVVSIEKATPRGEYPRVTKRIGKSPPQYPNFE